MLSAECCYQQTNESGVYQHHLLLEFHHDVKRFQKIFTHEAVDFTLQVDMFPLVDLYLGGRIFVFILHQNNIGS